MNVNVGIARGWASQALAPIMSRIGEVPMQQTGQHVIAQAERAIASQGLWSRMTHALPQTTTDAAAVGAAIRRFDGAIGDGIQGAGNAQMATRFAELGAMLRQVGNRVDGTQAAGTQALRVSELLDGGLGRQADGSLHPTTFDAVSGVREGLGRAITNLGLTARDGLL